MGRRVIVAVMMCVLLFSEGGTVKAAVGGKYQITVYHRAGNRKSAGS